MSELSTRVRDSAVWTMAGLGFLLVFLHYEGYTEASADLAYVGVVGCLFYASLPIVERVGQKIGNIILTVLEAYEVPELTTSHLVILIGSLVGPAVFLAALHFYGMEEILRTQIAFIKALEHPATPVIIFGIIVSGGLSGALRQAGDEQ